ncbi:MAG: hypothetical protein M3T96_02925 [Acidobacteriota bacterium]|nr:hypothetical protein [Acidobacteriota bacterium]
MEIFIVGIAVVVLMVYASTRIKKIAAEAYQPETIETEDYLIFKPEGFINPFSENSEFAFEANSKDWGKNDAGKFRQARAALRVTADADFKAVCENAKKSAGKITSKRFVKDAPDGQKIFILEGETSESDVKILIRRKVVEANKKVYELKTAVIEAYAEDFADRIGAMLESFTVK